MRRALLILATLAAPASAGQCVFYLKASTASFEARVYDPETGKDRRAAIGRIPAAEVLWEHGYEKVYWLDGFDIRRAWWLGKGKTQWPVPIPEDLGKPAAWWLDWRGLIGQRNILAHEYGRINHRLLYDAAGKRLPALIDALERIIGAEPKTRKNGCSSTRT